MLPAYLASNIRRQVQYYLEATFELRDPVAEEALRRFIEHPERGLFKGPWVSLRRPFRPAGPGESIPLDVVPEFAPHRHQWLSWRRLSSRDAEPRSTLITTGTGSGKTECFLYPILDHCLRERRRGRRGIHAILLYPMNALASDQERRFAQAIARHPELRDSGLRVGCYTGRTEGRSVPGGRGERQMGTDHGITNRDTLRSDPPDILLTNYKMLDYLLLRPEDRSLWRWNDSDTLRYLVLDELHTYDGAQGSDVACLIRRLKERLRIPRGYLCVVGTSATLESGDTEIVGGDEAVGPADRLAEFAGKLFEERLGSDAVISEDRLSIEEVLEGVEEIDGLVPSPDACRPLPDEDLTAFVHRQGRLWAGFEPPLSEEDTTRWGLSLAGWLRGHALFRAALQACEERERQRSVLTWDELVPALRRTDLRIAEGEEGSIQAAAFLALIAEARRDEEHPVPFIPNQVQLWIRELRRLGRVVSENPDFAWLDDAPEGMPVLPSFQCRECGESGWLAMHDPTADTEIAAAGVEGRRLSGDATRIYQGWFGSGPREQAARSGRSEYITLVSPWPEGGDQDEAPAEPGESGPRSSGQGVLAYDDYYLCPESLVLRRDDGPCPLTGDARRFRVRINADTEQDRETGAPRGRQRCPNCRAGGDSIAIVGCQAATISSLVIDEIFSSMLNRDAKLLAFTDSVQDASHRAGFFGWRTYNYTFRTAIQQAILAAPEGGLPLHEAAERLLTHWSRPGSNRPGDEKRSLASLLPPDVLEVPAYEEFRTGSRPIPDPELRRDLVDRLQWEVLREFGMRTVRGRTLEKMACSTVTWRPGPITDTLARLRDRLRRTHQQLADLEDGHLRYWLLGWLHRYREQGALDHPYVEACVTRYAWGKGGSRECWPVGRRPRVIAAGQDGRHENVLSESRGNGPSWPLDWARRALELPGLSVPAFVDLTRALLAAGQECGLLRRVHQNGDRDYFTIRPEAAMLTTDIAYLKCSETGRGVTRPALESADWRGRRSMQFRARWGRYEDGGDSLRHQYYRERYERGTLRRAVAREHTGLLETEDREALEATFRAGERADDPNILACTSTLEMGIDIGDLSATLLCSIPPSTTSYLQRIGRAGRATGTALQVAIVSQQPHDLFFYARPAEMLRGRIQAPGCWLDAPAVLERQFFAFCLDSAVRAQVLIEIPSNAQALKRDWSRPDGQFPRLLDWIAKTESNLQDAFLSRFEEDLHEETRDRFRELTRGGRVHERVALVVRDYTVQRQELVNAGDRLKQQLKELAEPEGEVAREIIQEQHVVRWRLQRLDRTQSLQLLTDHGLLPNYAFPERGVPFHGALLRARGGERDAGGLPAKPIELVRGAGVALRELAPGNHFYTHARKFDIQQVALGTSQEPLWERFAICGQCGHLRSPEAVTQERACPQCGLASGSRSQSDTGQQRSFLEFPRSMAVSQMDWYESLHGDATEERESETYDVFDCFDLTSEAPTGAVGDDLLPFGIEYRTQIELRQVNVGYSNQEARVAFGPDALAPETGFQVCPDCGVAVLRQQPPESLAHRRSCQARRRREKQLQEGRISAAEPLREVYLYRYLQSEAIRFLLPAMSAEDRTTLAACLYLGLRLQFQGDPEHLEIKSHSMPAEGPDSSSRMEYLVLLDRVPGGTGYLKSLFRSRDARLPGHGVVELLRRAMVALESCECRRLREEEGDHDGCYRCIRHYRQQRSAGQISRESGIQLLRRLLEAADRFSVRRTLAEVQSDNLLGTLLEQKFEAELEQWIKSQGGSWKGTVVNGCAGIRFQLREDQRQWTLERQPNLGPAQGVAIPSRPDFILWPDDGSQPVAIFTDGYAFHGNLSGRLADDCRKRRAILASGQFRCWSITWHDLLPDAAVPDLFLPPERDALGQLAVQARRVWPRCPSVNDLSEGGMAQLRAYLRCPENNCWSRLAQYVTAGLLRMHGTPVAAVDLRAAVDLWCDGTDLISPGGGGADWMYRLLVGGDLLCWSLTADVERGGMEAAGLAARCPDGDVDRATPDYQQRWRFLAVLNLGQFVPGFEFWAGSEVLNGTAPPLPRSPGAAGPVQAGPPGWESRVSCVAALKPYLAGLTAAGIPEPVLEHYCDGMPEEAFAELAWPDRTPPAAILSHEQESLAADWRALGWSVITLSELQAGTVSIVDLWERTR